MDNSDLFLLIKRLRDKDITHEFENEISALEKTINSSDEIRNEIFYKEYDKLSKKINESIKTEE